MDKNQALYRLQRNSRLVESQWARYCREFIGDNVIESNEGFVQYRYLNERQVYIVNIWIEPEYRQTGQASLLADLVVKEAKLKGCSELLGTVVPTSKDSTVSVKVLLGYDMKLKSAGDNLIIFVKEI